VAQYICQLLSFIKLRTEFAGLTRHYASPLGIPGAVFALVSSQYTHHMSLRIGLDVIGGIT
jgi:hypothetical protein